MANTTILGFMVGVPLIILVISFFMILKNSKKLKDKKSETYIVNLMSDYTGGYGIGKCLDEKHNKYKSKYEMFPFDIDYSRIKEKGFEVQNQEIFVKKGLEVNFPSKFGKIKLLLPHKPHLLPKSVRESLFGDYLSAYIQEVNGTSNDSELKDLREKRVEMLKEKSLNGGMGIAERVVIQLEEAVNLFARKSPSQPTPIEDRSKDEK